MERCPSVPLILSVVRGCSRFIPYGLALLLVSCSTTPGDAAYWGRHPRQAADLYRSAAEQGDALAAFKLGRMIEGGEVSDAQFGAAGTWFVRSCELGDMVGCHNVGVGYEYGSGEKLGLGKDLAKARDYYRRAAEHGYMQAQYNLGSMYANSYFTDDTEGLKWLLVAQRAARSCPSNDTCDWVLRDPPGHIERMKKRMSADDIALAGRQAAEWQVTE